MSEEKRAKKTPGVWGVTGTQFIHSLKDRDIQVTTTTGKSIRGTLIGADLYTIVIRQESGLELMIGKGNVVYLHGVRNGASRGDKR